MRLKDAQPISRTEEPLKVLVPFYQVQGEPPKAPSEMMYTRVGRDNIRSLVTHAGLMPVFVSNDMTPKMVASAFFGASAVYLAPGADLNPTQYGQEPHPKTKTSKNPDRDPLEIDIAQAALELGVPLLGDCRGAQVAAVAAGGELIQHLPDITDEPHGYEGEGRDPVYPSTHRHVVRTVPDTILAQVYGDETPEWPSIHHQSIKAPDPKAPRGECFIVSGWSPGGRIVEAIEAPGEVHPLYMGIQGHVEFGDDGIRIFQKLGDSAREYALTHEL